LGSHFLIERIVSLDPQKAYEELEI